MIVTYLSELEVEFSCVCICLFVVRFVFIRVLLMIGF